jgi:TolB-like protein/Tfp pilus assembly protein PilF/predicted Ser/Thr protein kinase
MGLCLLDEESVAGVVDAGLDNGVPLADRKKAAQPTHHGESVPRRWTKVLSDFGDYELLEEIGRGGQGVVYRAHQKSLNRIVALKVIGLGPWTTDKHLKRFRREAEAAAHLEHPYIVPIYEVGDRDDQCYFSMKFVEGGQLDEVVRSTTADSSCGEREPMSVRQAVALVAKVARTVHYAHEHGILHRDIKPGNILLDKHGEPHLTDFGLARLVEAESTVTGTLDVLGTPSYMAPEQAAGEHTKVSKATDVYGLGAVLYHLLTGHPPFAGGTTYETIRLLRDTEPRPPRLLNPKVDRELSTICLKCLEKDPQRRYSSALALAEDLDHWLKHEPIQAKPSGFFTHGRKWVRRNPSTAVLVTLLIAFAVGLGVTVWHRKPPVLIPKSVAVLPFENLSDDPGNGYFADGIQEEILTRLASIADLKVISRSSTQRYHSKPGNLAEIAKQLGVANIVEGSVQKATDQVRVNVQLINAQSDSQLWADTYDRKLTDILGVESEIAKRIAKSLQAKLTGQEEQALAVKPTSNPDAYDAYLRGLSFEARNYSSSSFYSADLMEKATAFYERAVQLDPNFALAWARLSGADAIIYFNYFDAKTATRGDAAKTALENAQKLEPNSPETLLALGYYQYHVLYDYGAAKITFARVSKMLPGSSEVPESLALVSRRDGHWDQSIDYFERALTLDPRNLGLLITTAETYAMLRHFPAALKLYDRALDITPNDPDIIAAKADIYQAQGNLQESARLLSGINEQTPNQGTFEIKLTQLQLERNYGEAIRLLQARQAQFHFDSQFDKVRDQVVLAYTQRLAGDTTGAKGTAEQARNTLEPLSGKNIATLLSQAYAAMGEKDSALKAAERVITLMPRAKDAVGEPGQEENLARIQAMFGENSRAISTLTQLLQTPYWGGNLTPITLALLRLDPIWDPLRSDPAFQKLCEEKTDKSIAVLPFENLSGDPNNAYFAEGIQEEILTRLAKIAGLRVISSASTQHYESKPSDLGEIAKELGVANILEGSVQKAADQVRVNLQLVNAQTNSHVWVDTYKQKLTDIFSVESKIAKRIAESLQAKLTGREEQALAVKATNNPEAYDAYLRGLALDLRGMTVSSRSDSANSYERAVQLDPNFALAWARLSRGEANRYYANGSNEPSRRDRAKHALEQAQKLEPDSPETLLTLGYYQQFVLGDYGAAKTTFRRVGELIPGSYEALYALGRLARREGHWDEAVSHFEQALALDPRNVELLRNATYTYVALRQFPAALKLYDRALEITPNDPSLIDQEARIYQAEGNLPEAARLLSGIKWQTAQDAWIDQLRYERKYGDAIRFLQAQLAQADIATEMKAGYLADLALTQLNAGDAAGAKASAEQALNILDLLYREKPDDPTLTDELSGLYALMGEKDSALKLAQRAVMLKPRATDAASGPAYEERLALVQALVGENSRAISTLNQLLDTPYFGSVYPPTPITHALLRLDPIWDPLRSDPAFQKLCQEKQP